MRWYDFFLPQRLLFRFVERTAIQEKTKQLLPSPYKAGDIYLYCRTNTDNENISLGDGYDFHPGDIKAQKDFYEKFDRIFPGIEATAISGMYLSDVWHHFDALDQHVYKTVENLSGNQIDSIGDLSANLKDSFSHSANFWDGLNNPSLDMFAGHLGEAYAAQDFSSLGMNVQWPQYSNNVGWDLLVNGHPVNVKLYADAKASGIHEHFTKYPDVPVILPGDAANIPAGAVHFNSEYGLQEVSRALSSGKDHLVLIDDSLSHDAVFQQGRESFDLAAGNIHGIHDVAAGGINFPVITALFSGWREIRLVKDNQTTFSAACKNFSYDIVGTGTGGFAGAKAGAVVGMLVGGPVGGLVGSLVGGLSGAVAGRSITNEMKSKKFKAAVGEYDVSVKEFHSNANHQQKQASKIMEAERWAQQQTLLILSEEYMTKIHDHMQSIREQNSAAQNLSVEKAEIIVQKALSDLDWYEDLLRQSFVQFDWKSRLLSPNVDLFALENALDYVHKSQRIFRKYLDRYCNCQTVPAMELYDMLAAHGLQFSVVYEILAAAEANRKNQEAKIDGMVLDAREKLAKARISAFAILEKKYNVLSAEVKRCLEPYLKKCKEQAEIVKQEAARLGINLN